MRVVVWVAAALLLTACTTMITLAPNGRTIRPAPSGSPSLVP